MAALLPGCMPLLGWCSAPPGAPPPPAQLLLLGLLVALPPGLLRALAAAKGLVVNLGRAITAAISTGLLPMLPLAFALALPLPLPAS